MNKKQKFAFCMLAILVTLHPKTALLANKIWQESQVNRQRARMGAGGAVHWNEQQGDVAMDIYWLRQFGDPQLIALIDEALSKSLDLGSLAYRAQALKVGVDAASSGKWPIFNFGFGGKKSGIRKQAYEERSEFPLKKSRRKLQELGVEDKDIDEILGWEDNGGGFKIKNAFDLLLDVQWEIDFWNKIGRKKAQAYSQASAASFDWRSARLALAAQVAKNWFQLVSVQRLISLTRRSMTNLFEIEDAALERARQGLDETISANVQAQQAAAKIAQTKMKLAQLEGKRKLSAQKLERLVGRYPSGKSFSNGETLAAKLPVLSGYAPAGLPSELLLRRPDLRAAEERFVSALHGAENKRLKMMPSLRLTGAGGLATTALSQLVDGDFAIWNIGFEILQPFFNGGALRAQAEAERLAAQALLLDYQNKCRKAFTEVEIALAADKSLARQELFVGEALEASARAFQQARESFRVYGGDVLAVLQLRSEIDEHEIKKVMLRRARLDNRVNLHLALGGDFTFHFEKRVSRAGASRFGSL